jgi:hypothetical protein
MRDVIGAHVEEIHTALAIPPQTNEVGRSVALLAGLFDLVAASGRRRIRLLELGASAGLNLLLELYAYRGDSWQFGPVDSKVCFVHPIEGAVRPEHFVITSRAGCDLHPVDAGTADGKLLLTSFVWPFDVDRHQRLAAALEIAASHPARIDKARARDWLPHALEPVEPETLTVVWHSITQMYWSAEEVASVETIMRSAGARQLLAEVAMEFQLDDAHATQPELRTRLWTLDANSPRERLLGTAHDHGVPVQLTSSQS